MFVSDCSPAEHGHVPRIERPRFLDALRHQVLASQAVNTVQRALPWVQGFGRPIAGVLAVALLLAAATAAAPLAGMRLVDALGQVAAALGSGRTILLALALVALAELAQVWLSRLLETRSWRQLAATRELC